MRFLTVLQLTLIATALEPGVLIGQQPLLPISDRLVRVAEADTFRLTPAIESADVGETAADEGEAQDTPKTRQLTGLALQLLKPIRAVELASTDPAAKQPDDRARELATTPDLYVTSEMHGVLSPRRYTVCSNHNPLYFEEPNLERCGNTCGCATTAISATHFLSSTIMVPYRLVTQPPCRVECSMTDCQCCQQMPCQRPFQCKLSGVVAETAAAAGFVFLLL